MSHTGRPRIVYLDPGDPAYVRLVRDTAEAFRLADVTPFLGAGISFEQPSQLPMASALVSPLVDVLSRAACQMYDEVGSSDAERLELDGVLAAARLERLLDMLHTTFGDEALAYLSPLMGTCWNPNHAAIGALARQGFLSRCITLNFDLLIEEASRVHGVSSRTTCPLVGKSFLTGSGPASLNVVKPHGSFMPTARAEGPHPLLSATLSQVGSRPMPSNVKAIRACVQDSRTLVVAGYSDNDWDIFPILPRIQESLRRVIWIDYRSESDVRARAAPWGNDPTFDALRDRVYPWMARLPCDSCILLGRARLFLCDILGELHISTESCRELPASQSADARRFDPSGGCSDPRSLRTMVAFALLVQQRNCLSERLLFWLRRQVRRAKMLDLMATVEDAIGHTKHTNRKLTTAVLCTRRARTLWRAIGESPKVAELTLWLGLKQANLEARLGCWGGPAGGAEVGRSPGSAGVAA